MPRTRAELAEAALSLAEAISERAGNTAAAGVLSRTTSPWPISATASTCGTRCSARHTRERTSCDEF